MKQLQYRTNPYIGQDVASNYSLQWKVWAEATIVTKEMRQKLRESQPHAGETGFRLVDTRKNPELAVK